jgi:hypothetical protein
VGEAKSRLARPAEAIEAQRCSMAVVNAIHAHNLGEIPVRSCGLRKTAKWRRQEPLHRCAVMEGIENPTARLPRFPIVRKDRLARPSEGSLCGFGILRHSISFAQGEQKRWALCPSRFAHTKSAMKYVSRITCHIESWGPTLGPSGADWHDVGRKSPFGIVEPISQPPGQEPGLLLRYAERSPQV